MKRLLICCAIGVLAAASLPARAGEQDAASEPARPAGQKKQADRTSPPAGGTAAPVDPLDRVRSLMRAFNLHDAEAMATHFTDDVQWFQIDGQEITVEATGVEQVRKAMADYFEAVPSARSVMEESMVSGRYVIFRERAFWEPSGRRTESSLAVYEMRGDRIHRVWYFPAEK